MVARVATPIDIAVAFRPASAVSRLVIQAIADEHRGIFFQSPAGFDFRSVNADFNFRN